MDFKNSLNASLIPIVALVVIGIIQIALGLVLQGILGLAMCIVGGVILLVQIVIYLWAGYHSVKKFKMDIAGAALTGAITGFVSSSVILVINLVLLLLNIGAAASATNVMGLGGTFAAGGTTLLVCLFGVIGVFITAIIGAILSAIGGLIAGKA